jgi:hypothetical protein
MNTPYSFRICAQLPGGPVMELLRSHERYNRSFWVSYTSDISRDWDVWTEMPMHDKHTLGGKRPVARTHSKPSSETRSRLYAANPHQEWPSKSHASS